jgi:outer membrane lipoprotein-sorting protein
MKLYLGLTLAFLFTSISFAQQDPEAKAILDRVSNKTKSYQTIEADFELTIDNRMEGLHSKSTGAIQIKGSNYLMESMGTSVYFDGVTMWSYMEDINEVTITQPDPKDGDFVDNPALIFSFYDRDFKYRLIGEVKVENMLMYEIDLYPNDLSQPYSRFKLYIRKENDAIYMVKAISKDAIDYTIYILNTRFNQEIDSTKFTFHPKNYPGIEIVDMRF